MKYKSITSIIIAVFFALLWLGISLITDSNMGIYAGLGNIYAITLLGKLK